MFSYGARRAQGDEVDLSVEYVPRPDDGLEHPLLDAVDGGVAAFGERRRAGPVDVCGPDARPGLAAASGRFQLRPGESMGFALHHGNRAEGGPARVWSPSRDTHHASMTP